jgi:hypothetical protein
MNPPSNLTAEPRMHEGTLQDEGVCDDGDCWCYAPAALIREVPSSNPVTPKLVPGAVYESKTHGHVEFKGVDTYMGQSSLKFFSLKYGETCYWLPEALDQHFVPETADERILNALRKIAACQLTMGEVKEIACRGLGEKTAPVETSEREYLELLESQCTDETIAYCRSQVKTTPATCTCTYAANDPNCRVCFPVTKPVNPHPGGYEE